MSWDFRRMLAIVKARREAREKLLATQNAKEDAFTKLSTDASVLAQKMLVEARAEQQNAAPCKTRRKPCAQDRSVGIDCSAGKTS